MANFRYLALDTDGREKSGLLQADSVKAARMLVREMQYIVLEVKEITTSKDSGAPRSRIKLSALQVCNITRQLASLLQSGLTVERALAALVDDCEEHKAHVVLNTIHRDVVAGASLALAMRQFPRVFSEIAIAMIAAGQETGDLALVALKLADYLEAREQLRSKLIQAFTYPCIVAFVALLVVSLLLAYVVPQVVGVFAGANQTLPLLTRALIAISDAIRSYGLFTLGVSAMIYFLATRAYRRIHAARAAFDRFWLGLPLAGRIARSVNSARFASTLAVLVSANVPILRALQAAADTLTNQALKADAEKAISIVREGASVANALQQSPLFPKLLLTFIRLGEQSGQLAHTLSEASKQANQEVQRRVLLLTVLLEPILILGMGLLVLLIVLAVLLPIMQINALVR